MKMWKVFSLAGLVVSQYMCLEWTRPGSVLRWDYRSTGSGPAAADSTMGSSSGAFTPQEARRLANEQRRIQAAEDRMRADGRLDPRERARLDRMQDKADRHIYRENHDNQVAYPDYRGHNNPPYRHWQDNQQRHHRQGNHYSRRQNGCDRGTAYRPNPGNQGRFSRIQHREHRTAWNR